MAPNELVLFGRFNSNEFCREAFTYELKRHRNCNIKYLVVQRKQLSTKTNRTHVTLSIPPIATVQRSETVTDEMYATVVGTCFACTSHRYFMLLLRSLYLF